MAPPLTSLPGPARLSPTSADILTAPLGSAFIAEVPISSWGHGTPAPRCLAADWWFLASEFAPCGDQRADVKADGPAGIKRPGTYCGKVGLEALDEERQHPFRQLCRSEGDLRPAFEENGVDTQELVSIGSGEAFRAKGSEDEIEATADAGEVGRLGAPVVSALR